MTAAVMSRFKQHEFAIRRLHASDEEFRMICEDYEAAVRALERWKEDEAKAEEYRQIVSELETEILEFVDRRHLRQAGKGRGG